MDFRLTMDERLAGRRLGGNQRFASACQVLRRPISLPLPSLELRHGELDSAGDAQSRRIVRTNDAVAGVDVYKSVGRQPKAESSASIVAQFAPKSDDEVGLVQQLIDFLCPI